MQTNRWWANGETGREAKSQTDRRTDGQLADRQTGRQTRRGQFWKLDVNVKVAKFYHFFFFHFKQAESAANFFLCFASIHCNAPTSRASSSASPSTLPENLFCLTVVCVCWEGHGSIETTGSKQPSKHSLFTSDLVLITTAMIKLSIER